MHHARANLNHANIILRLLQAKRLGQAASAELRRVVPGASLIAVLGSGGGQVQNRAVTVLAQRLCEGTHHMQNAKHIHLIHLQIVIRLTLCNLVHTDSTASNIDQGINGALLFQDLLGYELNGLLIGHIAGHRMSAGLRIKGVKTVSTTSQGVDGPATCY